MLKRRDWNIGDISVLMAVGTSLAIPIILWWGKIARPGNFKQLFFIIVLCGFSAYATMMVAGSYFFGLIGFGCISIVGYGITIPVISLLYKWYPGQSLPKAQSLTNSAVWISAIVAFFFNGYAIENFTETTCIIGGLVIALLALFPLSAMKLEKEIKLADI